MGRELSSAVRERRRDRILEAATEVFLQHGYAGATMGLVASRLGGSKGTLYAYFRNKDDLCEAIVRRVGDRAVAAIDVAQTKPTVREQLTQIGLVFIGLAVSDEGVRSLQLAIEASRANPALAQRVDAVAHGLVIEKVARLIKLGHRRGELVAPDAVEAARIFVSLTRGDLHFRRLLNLMAEPDPRQMKREVRRVVEVFMAAFGSAPESVSSRGAAPRRPPRRRTDAAA